MKEILAHIEQKKHEFSQLLFFEYLRDKSISPMQRLAFAPCAAPFVMTVGELNRSVFRVEPTDDPIQKIINKLSYEDDHHWVWFLEDLEKLNLNPVESYTKTLNFLWSEDTRETRRLCHEMYRCTFGTTPIQKLVVIEVIEATGNIAGKVLSKVTDELQNLTQKQDYRYFGTGHLMVEPGNSYTSLNDKKIVESIQINEDSKKESLELVDYIFSIFSEFTNSLLNYAKMSYLNAAVPESISHHFQNFKPIGSYLIEAGLLKAEQLQDALVQQKSKFAPIGEIIVGQGWVKQQTIEFLVEKIIHAERCLANKNELFYLNQGQAEDKQSRSEKSSKISTAQPIQLGTYLVEAALISTDQLQIALDEQQESNKTVPIGQILSRNGLVNQQTIEYLMEKIILPKRKVAVLK